MLTLCQKRRGRILIQALSSSLRLNAARRLPRCAPAKGARIKDAKQSALRLCYRLDAEVPVVAKLTPLIVPTASFSGSGSI